MTKKTKTQSATNKVAKEANKKKTLHKGGRQKIAAEMKCERTSLDPKTKFGLKKQTERLSGLAGGGKDKLICELDTHLEELQQQNELLSTILDHTYVTLACLDPDFNFIWVNSPYARSCLKSNEDLVGRNHFDLFPHTENEAIFRKVRDTGEAVFFKDKPFTYPDQPDRKVTYWDCSLVPINGENDSVANLVLSLRETTSFKHIHQELAESEVKFRTIAETSSDIIFQIEASGRMNYVSPAIRMLGDTPEDVIGRPFISQNYLAKYQTIPVIITIQANIVFKLIFLFLFISLFLGGISILLATVVKNKKPSHPFQGNSAILNRPVAFRPWLTAGLALSKSDVF